MPSPRRFLPHNTFISMCTPDDGWPSPLADAGYKIKGIETPMGGQGGQERATPDIIAFNESEQSILLVEAKSGGSASPGQAQRYVKLTLEEVVRGSKIKVREPDKLSKEVVYVCLRDNEMAILTGLQKADVDIPVLSVTEFEVRRVGSEFEDRRLNKEFKDPVTAKRPVPVYINLDSESSDSEFDKAVAGELVAQLSGKRVRVSVMELAKAICGFLNLMGDRERNHIIRKTSEAAERMATKLGFRFSPGPTRPDNAVTFGDQPERAHPRGRTQKYQALARRAAESDDSPKIKGQGRLKDSIDSGHTGLPNGE